MGYKTENINITDLFDIEELERFNYKFAYGMGVASTIIDRQGNPIISRANHSGLCDLIRSTERGLENCKLSGRILGEEAIKQQRPYISNCYSLGLVDAAAPVIINGQHVATWLIGQANIDNVDEERVIEYAKEVGADADKMLGLYNELQTKPEEDFRAKVELLWETSQHLAGRAYDKIYLEERVKEQTKVLEEKNRQLEELAYTDGETSCYNKKYLLQQLPKEMKRSGRFNHDLTLIMADLDYFKEINDQHGHLCGDRILEGIGGILQNNIRNGIDWVARYGGEEFLIVLPETNANDAYNVAERMRSKIDGSEFEYCDESIKLTASFGIGSYSPGMNLDALLNKADKNLYAAKNSGRDKVY